MKNRLTQTSSKDVRIGARTRELYTQRDRSLDNRPDAPTLPLELWEKGAVGKYFRPIKRQVTTRIDADVLAWLKSSGPGHLTRVNVILREAMERDRESAS